MHSAEYKETIKSAKWRALKRQKERMTGGICERCEWPFGGLELHHKHYDTLGHERPWDVELLCKRCHREADQERLDDAEERRISGWVKKVHHVDYDVLTENEKEHYDDCFYAWLESKEEY